MKLASQMTKPIQLLGWKQMKQVVANTSRLNFEISLRLLVGAPHVLIAKQHPHPPAKMQNHQNLIAGARDKNATDRQTDRHKNQRAPTPSFCIRQLFLSFFFFYFSFFLSFFFFFLSFFLSS